MRSVPLVLALLLLCVSALASETRESDLKTLERPGYELIRATPVPVLPGTKDRAIWTVANGKIHKDTKAGMDASESKPEKK